MSPLDQKLLDEVRRFRSGDGEGFIKSIRAIIRDEIINMQKSDERRKRLLPDDCPTDADRALAVKYWEKHRRPDLVARMDYIVEKFRAHHDGHGSKMAKWSSAWMTWYTFALDREKPPRDGLFSAPVLFEQASVEGWEKRLEIFLGLDVECPAGSWHQKWGPKPGEVNCRVPPELLRKRKLG